MRIEILKPDSERWPKILENIRHDFYHLPGYVRLEAERLGGEGRAVLIEDGNYFFFIPLVFRAITGLEGPLAGYQGAKDGTSPYGYPTALAKVPEGPVQAREFLGAALHTLRTKLAEENVAAIFMRGHPLIEIPSLSVLEDFGVIVRHGQTVWVDLALDPEEMWRQTRKSYRNLIRQMKRDGFSARIDVNWEQLPRFVELYNQTMDAVKAAGFYYFGMEYFEKLRRALGPMISLCVVEDRGCIVTAGLFTECAGNLQYHLSGSETGARHKDGAKLMLDYIRIWAKERGNARFHLGGGVGSALDNIFFFKSGFSSLRADFLTWRAIINTEIYTAAIKAWEEKSGQQAGAMEDYFPQYRRPKP